jgi:hypothetical protein
MATKTFVAAGGTWTLSASWSPAGVPTVNDDVIFNATSGNLSLAGTSATCKTANFTGYVGTISGGAVGFTCGGGVTDVVI